MEEVVEFVNSMSFNKYKYLVLHLEQNSQRAQYTLTPLWLGSCLAEKDGGSSGHPANMSQQHPAAADENLILNCIPRGITSRGRDMIIPLYSVLVRLHLEQQAPFRAPQVKKDTD